MIISYIPFQKSNHNFTTHFVGNSNIFCMFVMPNHVKIFESKRYLLDNRIKAGSLSDNSSSEVLRGLATTNRGLASLYTYITNFFQKMPNHERVSKVGNQITAIARRSAKKTSLNHYQVSLRTVVAISSTGKSGVYSTHTYTAASEEEAIGMACDHVNRKFPRHIIAMDEIECKRLYRRLLLQSDAN